MKLHSKFTQPIQNKVNQIKINQIICQWLIFDSTQLIFKIQQYKNANIANFVYDEKTRVSMWVEACDLSGKKNNKSAYFLLSCVPKVKEHEF